MKASYQTVRAVPTVLTRGPSAIAAKATSDDR
jgi:hypothetical protein